MLHINNNKNFKGVVNLYFCSMMYEKCHVFLSIQHVIKVAYHFPLDIIAFPTLSQNTWVQLLGNLCTDTVILHTNHMECHSNCTFLTLGKAQNGDRRAGPWTLSKQRFSPTFPTLSLNWGFDSSTCYFRLEPFLIILRKCKALEADKAGLWCQTYLCKTTIA